MQSGQPVLFLMGRYGMLQLLHCATATATGAEAICVVFCAYLIILWHKYSISFISCRRNPKAELPVDSCFLPAFAGIPSMQALVKDGDQTFLQRRIKAALSSRK